MHTLTQAAVGFLRVMGWLSLVGAGIFFAVDIVNAADAPDAIRGLNALIAIGFLLGGILVWAVCIALAAVAENSITIIYMLEDAADDARRQPTQPRERGISQRTIDMILDREMRQPPAKPNPGIRLRDQAAPVEEQAPHASRVTRVQIKK